MKITLFEIVALVGLFFGAMLPIVAGIIFAIRENRRLEKENASKPQ
jgi:hypothetical protein